MPDAQAYHEKNKAAVSSVIAAVVLTGAKIVVGVLTGSLGILAEALHSALDLLAAVVTVFAVRIAGRPADAHHHYGHGKIENLSALFETVLLLGTSLWIIYEAINRLFFTSVALDISAWAYAVMILSIVIDVSRSRMLYRVAKKHNSQALEADALHFSTDIWSSAVVLFGLVCVSLADRYPRLAFLGNADAIAALMVALLVLYVTFALGMRATQSLLDRAPDGMDLRIKEAVEQIPGIEDCHRIRIRPAGAHIFVDLHVYINGAVTLAAAHALTVEVEKTVEKLIARADVVVHAEPLLEPGHTEAI